MEQTKKKLIIDVDTGVDDAQALMMALRAAPDHEIVAITCVAGNVDIEKVCINTLRIVRVCGRQDVAIYKGCRSALVADSGDASVHHGGDGLGDAPDPEAPDISLLQSEHAATALVRLANTYPGEITLVALAPLTNIAMALKLDPRFGEKLKDVVIMGGNIEGKGNIVCCAEFNFYSDPEAAFITLRDLHCPIRLISWETCTTCGLDWTWHDEHLLKTDTPLGKFHAKITAHSTRRKKEYFKTPLYYSCDPSAMAVALDPTCVIQSTKYIFRRIARLSSKGH